MYFEDFPVGTRFETERQALSEDEIVAFARQWDPQPFHTDAAAAAQSIYGGLIASGFHTLLVAFGLTLKAGGWAAASMGSPGIEDLRWSKPVKPGDVLHVRAEVLDSVPSRSRPEIGRTKVRYVVLRGEAEEVMQYTTTHLLKRRPNQVAGAEGRCCRAVRTGEGAEGPAAPELAGGEGRIWPGVTWCPQR